MATIDRNHPVSVTIKERYPLTKMGSTKQTWHITLDLQGVDLDYHPGDSVGIYAQNDPLLVEHIIQAMQAKPSDTIFHKRTGQELSLSNFLTHHANLSRLTTSFLKLLHENQTSAKIEHLLLPENKLKLRGFLEEQDPLNLLRDYAKNKLPLQQLCDQFGPLLPRFYSVASSKRVHETTLDLTVALFTWMQSEEKRYGVASHFLCHLAELGKTPISLFVQPARHFRLPKDPHTDIIMVGPGTGIAPFRAFMQERGHHGSQAKHWLFFGERNSQSDYFYESDWTTHANLKVHTAFSRDQKEKVYVQHKMEEHAKELYTWLEKGAHFYVCGDAKVMAKDVEKTLQKLIIEHGQKTEAEAKDFLKTLRKSGRYLLDVY